MAEPDSKAKSDAKECVPSVVWETLTLAETDGKKQAFDDSYSTFNLGLFACDVKLRSHLMAVAHNLAVSKKGDMSYSFSLLQGNNEVECSYAGFVKIKEEVPFEVNIKLAKGSKVEIKLEGRPVKTETCPVSMEIRDKAMFLFDYAIADIKDWPEFIGEIIAEKERLEEEDCELD
jgi:hypothetical protein